MAIKGKVNFSIIGDSVNGQNTRYIGDRNDVSISSYNSHLNTYFNIDVQQSAYFTMLIDGFEYGRFHASYKSITSSINDGRRDMYYDDQVNKFQATEKYKSTGFENFGQNGSIFWLPLKSLQYSQGSIENMTVPVAAFADLQLPFRKRSPSFTVEMYDHRSDFYEMKLREWHTQSVVTGGYVPVLESIAKKVTIRGWATNGECNSVTECLCILGDDITTNRSYDANDLKIISFKLIVVGY